MATTMISPAGSLPALDRYTGSIAAKDVDGPEPTERSEFCSTIGDCTPETFVARVREDAAQHGKSYLKHEAYHLIISQTHEEADPRDPEAGHRQHVMAVALVKKKFPGHLAKLITQRDNGKWIEGPDGERVWGPGKWHTHCIVANVSSREAVLAMPDGTERRYAAGRAIDGAMKNIHAIRHGPGGADALILEHMGYDNARYVDACREWSAGRGDRATTRDMADRRDTDGPGHSAHDEVRVRLREARSLADSWDDYVSRLAADNVQVRVTGKSGVSYRWVGDDGVEHAASARSRKGRDGVGNDFTRAAVEERCEINRASRAAGVEPVAPERELVPAPVAPAERPRPVYLTPDGRPPWERDLDEYAETVRESGGTVEQVARERIDLALEDDWITDGEHLIAAAPDHGIEFEGRTDEPLISLDTSGGRVCFESGHLGADYTGARLDRRMKNRGKDRDHDYDRPGSSARRDAERRSAAGIGVERVDGAALAALQAGTAARIADQRTERHVDCGERAGDGLSGAGTGQQRGRGDAERAEQQSRGADSQGRSAGREAGSDTPLRDAAVRRESKRPDQSGERERD